MDYSALHAKLIELLELDSQRAYWVLDFGCGTGELLARIAKSISNESHLVGLDASEESISWARQKHSGVEFQADKFIDTFDHPDASFDVIVSVDTLECVPDKEALLKEFVRLLKPKGRLLVAHWDWDTQVYHSAHKDVVRRVIASFADWQQGWMDACDGQMGRKLWGLFEGSGLFRGEINSYTAIETDFSPGHYGYDRLSDVGELVGKGEFSKSDYDLLRADLQSLHERGEYFYS
ncbi:MAG: methyltransferase domain-containing protein, partial [Pseudomonadota bacterium]